MIAYKRNEDGTIEVTASYQETITIPAPVVVVPDPDPDPVPDPNPTVPAPQNTEKYRSEKPLLFQGAVSNNIPWRLGPTKDGKVLGTAHNPDGSGPTAIYVDFFCGWPWKNIGGDWLDKNAIPQGPQPWASVTSPHIQEHQVTLDVTEAYKYAKANGLWNAYVIQQKKAIRKIYAAFSDKPPVMRATYEGGETEDLKCLISALVSTGKPSTTMEILPLPAFLEFENPSKDPQKLEIVLTVSNTYTTTASIEANLLNPPKNPNPTELGVAQQAGDLDENILSAPGIIYAHRYVDGTVLEDFFQSKQSNKWAEREFSPEFWGGEKDETKLPYRDYGKFINTYYTSEHWDKVDSNYEGQGFKPLAPGLGAIKFNMVPRAPNDCDIVGYGGDSGGLALMYLPADRLGYQQEIYLRQYIRLGFDEDGTYTRSPYDRRHYWHGPEGVGPCVEDRAGKFGMAPEHQNSYGSGSGTSGGGKGWMMRMSWEECDGGVAGPDEGGFRLAWHLYDFQGNNPKGYQYTTDGGIKTDFGQIGGKGGVFYAGHWYCLETYLRLNDLKEPDAEDPNGFIPNGILRTWVDGVLVYGRTGMVFRSKPFVNPPANKDLMRPIRDLGVKAIEWIWYHGGITQTATPRTVFMTGLAYGDNYIGPMKGVPL